MATDYSSENPHSQLAKLRAEQPHIQRLAEAASMWSTAQQRIRAARDELSTRTDALEASWRDDAGRAFGARVDESLRSLQAWQDRIEGSGVVGQINALQLTYPNCVAGVQAVCARFEAEVQAQQAGGGAVDMAALERQYAQEAAHYTNHVAERMDKVTAAMGALVGPGQAGTDAGQGGPAGAGSEPGGSPAAGEQPPGEGQSPEGAQQQGSQAEGQSGGSQEALQQGMAAAQQVPQALSQLAEQLGGADANSPVTDPSLLDPTRPGEFPDPVGNGQPGLAGLGGGGVGSAGVGGGFSPVAQSPNLGSSPVPTGAAPGLAGAPATGTPTAGTGGMGGMAPMMPMHGAGGGLGAAGGVRPGDAERTERGRPRDGRAAGVAGVPATLRGRSGRPAPAGGGTAASARRREERANDAGEVLDEELWHVAGQDHKRADTRGTLRSKR